MRALLSIVTLCLAAPVAFADPPGGPADPPQDADDEADAADDTPAPAPNALGLEAIVIDEIAERCRAIAVRTETKSVEDGMSARIALAGCIADAALSPLSLIDGEESVLAIEAAVAPAFALLDGVNGVADLATRIIALHAKAGLYGDIIARMQRTVPRPVRRTYESDALYDTRRKIVDGMVMPWRTRAREVHESIVDLGMGHPELARNPVVTAAIRDSRRQLGLRVARR